MVSLIAKNMKDRRTTKAIKEIFEKADRHNDGKISICEFMEICSEYGVEVSDEEMANIEELAMDGKISQSDFVQYVKTSNMFKAFDTVDNESDIYWERNEFSWMVDSKRVTSKTIDLVFKRCDTDRDGRLDYEEFKAMFVTHRERKDVLRLKDQEVDDIATATEEEVEEIQDDLDFKVSDTIMENKKEKEGEWVEESQDITSVVGTYQYYENEKNYKNATDKKEKKKKRQDKHELQNLENMEKEEIELTEAEVIKMNRLKKEKKRRKRERKEKKAREARDRLNTIVENEFIQLSLTET